jgi:16S rRNA (guanine527-N7)-methyltransferase
MNKAPFPEAKLLARLQQLISATDLVITSAQEQQLIALVAMLHKWNKAYNLTSVRDPQEMLVRHILDSLVVSPYLHGDHIIDVGTGPGLPGLPLAICNPDKQFVLLDSLGKRINFIRQVIHELKLTNVTPVLARVQDYQPNQGFSSVISRAFASLADMLSWCHHLPSADGRFIALKGQPTEEELATVALPFTVKGVYALNVPELNAARHVVEIQKE